MIADCTIEILFCFFFCDKEWKKDGILTLINEIENNFKVWGIIIYICTIGILCLVKSHRSLTIVFNAGFRGLENYYSLYNWNFVFSTSSISVSLMFIAHSNQISKMKLIVQWFSNCIYKWRKSIKCIFQVFNGGIWRFLGNYWDYNWNFIFYGEERRFVRLYLILVKFNLLFNRLLLRNLFSV